MKTNNIITICVCTRVVIFSVTGTAEISKESILNIPNKVPRPLHVEHTKCVYTNDK